MTDDIQKLTDAMGQLVDALRRHRAEAEADMAASPKFSIKPLRLPPDLAQLEIDEMTGHPIEWALRRAIKAMGQKIHDVGGGLPAVHTAVDILVEREDAKGNGDGGRVIAMLDAALNGVGVGERRWWS